MSSEINGGDERLKSLRCPGYADGEETHVGQVGGGPKANKWGPSFRTVAKKKRRGPKKQVGALHQAATINKYESELLFGDEGLFVITNTTDEFNQSLWKRLKAEI